MPRRLDGKLEVDLPARPRRSTTAASPTTAGCRNCPSPSPSSPGTMPRSSARATAHRLGVQKGDMLKLTYEGRTLERAGFRSARPRQRRRDAAPGLRPHARRPRRHRHGLQSLRAAHRQGACGRISGSTPRRFGGKYDSPTTQNFHLLETPDRRHIIHRADLAEFKKNPEAAHEGAEVPAARTHHLPRVEVRRLRVGHGDRSQLLHRMRRMRGRLPGGEQHRRCRQRPGAPRPRHALAARRFLLPGRRERSGDL